jgi:tetratricopeptide (TPR) repeat protein/CHAT domain-containing protein
MKRTFTISLFILWSSISYCQTTKDSIAELQNLLDSIPDISLAELGIDTTAEIVPDTLHLAIPTSIASDTAYARTCLNQAIELIKTGKYDNAYAKADTAKYIFQINVGYVSKEVADCLHQMGRGFYYNEQYFKAIKNFEKALEIRLRSLDLYNVQTSNTYHNLGMAYDEIGNYEKAIKNYEKALEIRLRSLDLYNVQTSNTYHNLGMAYDEIGNYEKAINNYRKALEIRIVSLDSFNIHTSNTFNNIGVSLYNMRQYNAAIYYYTKGLEIRIINNDSNLISTSFNNLGNAYLSLGAFEKAIDFHYKSLELRKKNIAFKSQYLLGHSYTNLGNCFHNMGDKINAINYYSKALEYFKTTKNISKEKSISLLLNNMGEVYMELGEIKNSISLFLRSKSEMEILFKNSYPKIILANLNLIKSYLILNMTDSCLYYQNQAISGIKAQMTSDISAETKNLYQSQNIPVFELAIEVSMIKSKQDQHDSLKLKTYEYTELAKASLLQSQIKQTDALAFSGIPNILLQKEYNLRIDINWREKQRQGLLEKGKEETDKEVLRISSIIFDLKREQETLFETLEKDYPEYYRLKYDTKTIGLGDTQQKLLQKDQTMLEYFVGDSSIFIFVVRPNTFDVVQVKKDFALDSLVRQMQSGLYGYYGLAKENRKDEIFKKSLDDFSEASYNIYQRIVAPVQHLLTPDLVIIPDGVLGYVPFEALLKNKPEKLNQFAAYPYMINDHTISYNYSATLWQEMKNKKHKKEPSKSLVAFAPFYEESFSVLDSTINLVFDTLADGKDTTIFEDVVTRKTYAPLPSSGIEAGTVSKMYKGDYFVNSDATEQKFYDVASDYRMVHLSTHGVADARQGDYSYLSFAEQKDSIENEFLFVRDIYNTQLNADLVFLSACETAQGELQRGEGIISLARAFA